MSATSYFGEYRINESAAEEREFYVKYPVTKENSGETYTGYLVHRKIILNSPYVEQLHSIIEIQGSTNFPLIRSIKDIVIQDDLILLVLEKKTTPIFSLFQNGTSICKQRVQEIFFYMGSAIQYLHRHNIAFLDIRPDLFFIAENGLVKLSGFEHARQVEKGELISDPYGTVNYSAPEVFEGPYSPFPADVWALGLTMLALLTGATPFRSSTAEEVERKIATVGEFALPGFLPGDSVGLLRGMLRADPAERITVDDVMNHPWVSCNEAVRRGRLRFPAPAAAERILRYFATVKLKARERGDGAYSVRARRGRVLRFEIRLREAGGLCSYEMVCRIAERADDFHEVADAINDLCG